MTFILYENPTANPLTHPRNFRTDRDDATRRHAGVDYYQSEGTTVKAMADGVIIDVSGFFMGSFEVAVQSTDGSIVRYTELLPDKSVITRDAKSWQYKNQKGKLKWGYDVGYTKGQEIKQGQVLGQMKPLKFPSGNIYNMLHLEVYYGNVSGTLSTEKDYAIEKMDYVPDGNYNRRADLIDPTWSKYLK